MPVQGSLDKHSLEGIRGVGGIALSLSARAHGLPAKFYEYTPEELDFVETHLKVQGIF